MTVDYKDGASAGGVLTLDSLPLIHEWMVSPPKGGVYSRCLRTDIKRSPVSMHIGAGLYAYASELELT